jgi:hypothetical protein
MEVGRSIRIPDTTPASGVEAGTFIPKSPNLTARVIPSFAFREDTREIWAARARHPSLNQFVSIRREFGRHGGGFREGGHGFLDAGIDLVLDGLDGDADRVAHGEAG